MRRIAILTTVAAALALAACGRNDDTGRLTLAVTDAPVDDAARVVVVFTGVELKPADRSSIEFDFSEPRSIDLLALQGGGSETILEDVVVPAGPYEWVRLKVTAQDDGTLDSFVEFDDGAQHELHVPSGAESGLKLHSGFTVPAGSAADFTVDFDLRKSLHQPMNASTAYTLRPSLRLVDNVEVGAIAGSVAAALLAEGCTPAVYVFSGADVTPDDVDGNAVEPVTSAAVALDSGSGEYRYRAAWLPPGVYTVAFTCGAAADNPAADDSLAFAPAQGATVSADQTTTVNIAPGP